MSEITAASAPGGWITAIPMPYFEGSAFWRRDMGLLALGLRDTGVPARFAALGEGGERNDLPLVLGSLADFSNSEWWRRLNAQTVVLTAWGMAKYQPIARAIKQAGATLIMPLDTDGMVSPRLGFGAYLKTAYSVSKDLKKPVPPIFALGKTIVYRVLPAAYESGFLKSIAHADILLLPVPKAKELVEEFFARVKRPELADKLRILPYPVASSFVYDSNVKKANEIVCVGRWQAHQKDAPTLIRVLGRVVEKTDYSATICGPGEKYLSELSAGLPDHVRERLNIAGSVANENLNRIYQRAKIFLVSSRHESFNIAAAEALCCGCSLAGPATIPSMHYLTGSESGTVAKSQGVADLASALENEMKLWDAGKRDPQALSELWSKRLHPTAVASKLLEIVRNPRAGL